MPACRASQLRSPLVSSSHLNSAHHRRIEQYRPVCGLGLRRQASTAPIPAHKAPAEDLSSFRNKTKTVLHKTDAILPRILGNSSDLPQSARLSFWKDVLDGAYVDLNSVADRSPARVVIYGCDEHSGARDLITALLEEPFAPPSRNEAIRERWEGANEQSTFRIAHGFTQSAEANCLRIPSTWMQQFKIPIEIGEVPPSTTPDTSGPAFRTLFAADIPIIVCNPIATPLPAVLSDTSLPLAHGNAILVITSSPSAAPEHAEFLTKRVPSTLKVLILDPARATEATQTLSSNHASPTAVQQYQDNFTGSKVSELTSAIAEKLAVGAGDASAVHTITAREATKLSLLACLIALERASREVDGVILGTLELKDMVAELQAHVEPQVLGLDAKEVHQAVEKAKKDIAVVMDRLNWWRFIWRVDDVGDTLSAAVDKAWCRDLEDRLVFHGGRLASAQQALAASTYQLVSSYRAPSPFHSPVLSNHLEQLQASPTYAVAPSALITPIHTRRAQMQYPTTLLQTTAQRLTVGMGGSVLSGCAIAWAGWAEHLGIISGALSTGMQVETALGAGMLVAALGMRWMVGRWDRTKKRWWRDYDRIGEGLARDLKATLDNVITKQVALVPKEAIDGLDQLAEKRKDEIDALKEEVRVLEEEIKDKVASSIRTEHT